MKKIYLIVLLFCSQSLFAGKVGIKLWNIFLGPCFGKVIEYEIDELHPRNNKRRSSKIKPIIIEDSQGHYESVENKVFSKCVLANDMNNYISGKVGSEDFEKNLALCASFAGANFLANKRDGLDKYILSGDERCKVEKAEKLKRKIDNFIE